MIARNGGIFFYSCQGVGRQGSLYLSNEKRLTSTRRGGIREEPGPRTSAGVEGGTGRARRAAAGAQGAAATT